MTKVNSRRRLRTLAATIVVGMLTPLAIAAAPATSVEPATDDPFAATTEILFSSPNIPSGCYRIPAITKGADGSLLAFAERRKHSCADRSDTDIVMRRLPPGATQWLPEQTVSTGEYGDPNAPATRGNPGPVVYRTLPGAPDIDAPDGRLVLMGTHNPVDPDTPGSNHRNAPRTPFVQYSDDDGATWTEPDSLEELDDPSWGHYATGPVHAIQLTRVENAGRLVVGVNYGRPLDDGTGNFTGGMLVYSDDAGETWHRGAQVEFRPEDQLIPQEISVVELANGDVMAWARQQWNRGSDPEEADPYLRPHRAVALSKDGGETFAQPFAKLPGFEVTPVQSSVLRMDATDEGDAFNRIVSSAPALNTGVRMRMTIRASFDEGRTWQSVDTPLDSTDEGVQVWGTNDRTVAPEECACQAGYSDMVELDDGGLGLLYERGPTDYRSEIAFVRLDDVDLHTPSRTPDARGASALVFDGVVPERGRYGRGFSFDGERGRVQLPYRTTPVLGSGDFTVATWVKYDDEDATEQELFSAYGDENEPGVRLVADPGNDQLRGIVTTAEGATTVTTADALADGSWHHVALRRLGDTLTLFVDGRPAGTATGAAGVIAGDDPTAAYLGQRLDGTHRFQGTLDEFRGYDRALGNAEVAALHAQNARITSGLTIDLGMNAVIPPGE